MKKYISAFIVTAVAAGYSYAGGVGTTAAQFLKIEPSARPMAMGGAFSAVSDDTNAVFYNPAGLAGQDTRQAAGTYVKYFQDITYGSLAASLPGIGEGVLGIGVNYLDAGDLEKRSADDVNDPDGVTYVVDTFSAMDTAITLSYALKNPAPGILDGMDIGANVRAIYQVIDADSAVSFMMDAGAIYPVNDKLSLSFVLQNVGLGVKYASERDPLPLNIRVGASFKPLQQLVVACDISEYLIDEVFYASVGAEYTIKKIVALRAGYKYGYDTESLGSMVGLTGGLGIRYLDFGLDYAWAPFGELGDTHRVTFSIKL